MPSISLPIRMKCLEGNSMKKNSYFIRFLFVSISLVMSAGVYNLFLLPCGIVTGESSGIATITHSLYEIEPAIMIFLISIACSTIGLMYLGKDKIKSTVLICLAYPVLIKLTENIGNWIHMDRSDILLVVLISSVLGGIANGLMYKSGYSRGGLSIISQVLYEKKKISISKSSFFMSIGIILIGSIFFGLNNALYAFIYLYINSIVVDKVLLGISNNKAFYIITYKEKEIREYIFKNLHHSVTVFDVKGGFLEEKQKAILTVIPSREYYHLTEGIKKIDKSAFYVATDAYEVEGAK